MVVVNLISAIIATSLYMFLTPVLLAWMLVRDWSNLGGTETHEYARKKEAREEPPFTLESAERVKLFRKCVGEPVATVPIRRVQSKERSGKLVSSIAQTEDTLLPSELRQTERGQRTHASLRRVRSNAVRDWKAERKSGAS